MGVKKNMSPRYLIAGSIFKLDTVVKPRYDRAFKLIKQAALGGGFFRVGVDGALAICEFYF
jgi:RPE4 domain-containing protein